MRIQPEKSKRLAVLTNPQSGRNRGGNPSFYALLSTEPDVVHRTATSPDEIRAALSDLEGFAPDVLAINAGDGTVAAVLTAMMTQGVMARRPLIALLHGGTANVTANDIGVRGKPAHGLRSVLRWLHGDTSGATIRERAILRIEPPGAGPICGMVFGAGAIIGGIEYCHEKVHGRGVRSHLGAGLCGLRVLWAMVRSDERLVRPVAMKIERQAPGSDPALQTLEGDFAVTIASSLHKLALGARPFWGLDGGAFHWSAIKFGARHLGRVLPAILFGRNHRLATAANGYFSGGLSELQLTWEGHFMVDGEVYDFDHSQGPVRISEAGRLSFLCV